MNLMKTVELTIEEAYSVADFIELHLADDIRD